MNLSTDRLDPCSLEFQLACLCCRVDPPAEQIADRLGGIDVPAFIELVLHRHRVGPLVHAALKCLPDAALPPGLMDALSAAARDNAVKALRAHRALILLARWFADAGITWMPFKGLSLAQAHYGGIALRQVNDLDIWVPGASLARARDVLQGKGFCLDIANHQWDLVERGPRHQAYLMRYHHELQYRSTELGLLELHWQMSSSPKQFRLLPEQMLQAAQHMDLGGISVPTMNRVDLLLYLCEHGGRHGWARLKWLADLPRLLEQPGWDWPAVLARAGQMGCMRPLLHGLDLCRTLFGWEPPPPLRGPLRSGTVLPVLRRIACRNLQLPPPSGDTSKQMPLAWHLRDGLRALLLAPSFDAIAEQVWRRLLTPKDLQLLALPDRAFFLYFLLRPIISTIRRWR